MAAGDARIMTYAQEGYHIGYDQVSVTRRGVADGKITYYYLNSFDANARNMVLEEITTNGANQVVKKISNTYQQEISEDLPLQKVYYDKNLVFRCVQNGCDQVEYWTIHDQLCETIRDTYHCLQEPLIRSTREQILPVSLAGTGALPHEVVRTYSYDRIPTGQLFTSPSWVRQFLQTGQQVATHTAYARQYMATTGLNLVTQGLADLAAHHMLTAVVETQQWRHQGPDSALVSGSLTHYQHLQPRRVWNLETQVPVLPTAFIAAHLHNQDFVQDGRYTEAVSYDQYDPWGNVREEHFRAIRSSYLWDDEGTHLLAKVNHAHYSQIGYTSFEPTGSGRWTYDPTAISTHSFTGWQSYVWGTTAIALDSLPASTYALTLWATAPPLVRLNGVSVAAPAPAAVGTAHAGQLFRNYCYRLPLTATQNTVAISGPVGELVDEVRLYPVEALMQSYTQEPLNGLLSQTDPSGRVLLYEYDGLGRLVRTRDEQGRILSQQQYHYAGK